MSAIAGIDQSLWDIKGKALGVPAHELLGGRVRDRMKVYREAGAAGFGLGSALSAAWRRAEVRRA